MPKIQNLLLKNRTAVVSVESVEFDAEGIGELQSKELYTEVLELAHFYKVESKITPSIEDTNKSPKDKPKEEILESKTTENEVDVKSDLESSKKNLEEKTPIKRNPVSKI